jgi:hypothetical protein
MDKELSIFLLNASCSYLENVGTFLARFGDPLMSIRTLHSPAEPRPLLAVLSLVALCLLMALLAGLLASRLDPTALDQAYAVPSTT